MTLERRRAPTLTAEDFERSRRLLTASPTMPGDTFPMPHLRVTNLNQGNRNAMLLFTCTGNTYVPHRYQ